MSDKIKADEATEPSLAKARCDEDDGVSPPPVLGPVAAQDGDDGREAALRASSEDDPAPRPIPR